MKKILTLNIIIVCLLLFSNCSVWNKIGAGRNFYIKMYSIRNRNASRNKIEMAIIDLFERKILSANIDRRWNLNNRSNDKKYTERIDSIRILEKQQYYSLDTYGYKKFTCYLSTAKSFYFLKLYNCQSLCFGCDLGLIGILTEEGISDYQMTKQEQKMALLAFEHELLPLIKDNVKRLQEKQK